MNEQDLLELKKQIAETASTVDKYRARKELLMEQLHKEYKIKTIKEAQKKIDDLERGISELDTLIAEATERLERQLNE